MDKNVIQSQAIEFARKNRKRIAKDFTDPNKYKPNKLPVSVFMAGSPGAGKTEFSKNLVAILGEQKKHDVIRIDPDDMRELLPGYTRNNSYLFQGAVSLIVEKIHDFALSQNQSFIFDGTLSNYEKAANNIKRSLSKGRLVHIFYIYQKPKVAWGFTQKREAAEGRNIPKEAFIQQFFGAQETVGRLRKEFGEEVNIFMVKKDFEKNSVMEVVEIKPGGPSFDDYIKDRYTNSELYEML